MHADRFDTLAKYLATPTTRRATLGAAAGGLLSVRGLGRAAPVARAAQGATCAASGLTDCGGLCVNLTTDALNCGTCGLECAYGEVCGDGLCQSSCAVGLRYCNGVCVDTASDPSNCGFCGNPCAGFSACLAGTCRQTTVERPGSGLDCAARGLTDCGGVCVDLLTDDVNCGACGNRCDQLAGYCLGDGTCCACCRRPGDPRTEPVCSA
jgi:hypothetical protein